MPFYNGSATYTAGTAIGSNVMYQKYTTMDLRYSSRTDETYLTLGKKVYMYLHNFNPDDMSFEPDATVGNIFTINNIEKRFPKTEEGEVYLWFLGWSGGNGSTNWYSLAANSSQLHTIYIYKPSTGELRNTNILVG